LIRIEKNLLLLLLRIVVHCNGCIIQAYLINILVAYCLSWERWFCLVPCTMSSLSSCNRRVQKAMKRC